MVAHFHTGYVKCDISKVAALRRTFILYRRHCRIAVALKFIDDARQAMSITSRRCIEGHALTHWRLGIRCYRLCAQNAQNFVQRGQAGMSLTLGIRQQAANAMLPRHTRQLQYARAVADETAHLVIGY